MRNVPPSSRGRWPMLPRRVFEAPDTEVMAEMIRIEERLNFMIALVYGVR